MSKSGCKEIWETADCRKIAMEDLEDRHLLNCINYSIYMSKEIGFPWRPTKMPFLIREAEFRGLDWRRLMKNHLTPAEKYMELFL